MRIKPREYELKYDEKGKNLLEKTISELPPDLIAGIGEAQIHFSQALGGTFKIYPSKKSRITEIHFPEEAVITGRKFNSTLFEYRGKKFLIIYD